MIAGFIDRVHFSVPVHEPVSGHGGGYVFVLLLFRLEIMRPGCSERMEKTTFQMLEVAPKAAPVE